MDDRQELLESFDSQLPLSLAETDELVNAAVHPGAPQFRQAD